MGYVPRTIQLLVGRPPVISRDLPVAERGILANGCPPAFTLSPASTAPSQLQLAYYKLFSYSVLCPYTDNRWALGLILCISVITFLSVTSLLIKLFLERMIHSLDSIDFILTTVRF